MARKIRRRRNISKLRDKKINTIVEKRMQEIAIKEHDRNTEKLIYRQYLWGAYNMDTNAFNAGSPLDFTGMITALAAIQKLDNATAPAVPPMANPYQTPSTQIPPGVNVIGPIYGKDGFRVSSNISIVAISMELDIRQPRIVQDSNLVPPLAEFAPDYSYCDVHWSIIGAEWDGSEAVGAVPDAREVCSIPLFGYSSKLDKEYTQTDLGGDLKKKTIAKGKVRMKISVGSTSTKMVKRYIKFKRPIRYTYTDADQNGQQVIGQKLFLVVRSTIPSGVPHQVYRPLIRAVTKVFYIDE